MEQFIKLLTPSNILCKEISSSLLSLTAPSCQKETYREYYQEDGCRSTKKLKLAECVGSCGEQCCTAAKTKKRPVKMVCSDGSVFTKHIEIVRKCACNKKCDDG